MSRKLILPQIVFILFSVVVLSCKKDTTEGNGRLSFTFTHNVGNAPIQFDTMMYVNAAGNPYLVDNIQYFISDVILYKDNGTDIMIKDHNNIWYVDTDLPDTWHWDMADVIPEGKYDSIAFRFGLSEERNKSHLFVNPPESNMFWPEHLGGGYHYMKLNGKWEDSGDTIRPFNFHMGIGQIYDDNNNIISFVPNDFVVHLNHSGFTMEKDKTVVFEVAMDVNEWFEDPHVFDFNYWGGQIMQNQEAMRTAAENGHNVFSIHRMIEE